jgi:serpin B
VVNAIYFKADWLHQFEATSTHDAPFYLLDGTTVTTPMMHQDTFIPYAGGNGYQAVELAYSGSTAAMDIFVPDKGNFETFESSFDREIYDKIISSLQAASVEFGFPQFEFSSDFTLSDQLASLGMPDTFNPDQADFSGMTSGRDAFISRVVHKAFVAVDEKGTEAAAATITIMIGGAAAPGEINLIVDRPFIFVIRDLGTGQILFVGRVTNPQQ